MVMSELGELSGELPLVASSYPSCPASIAMEVVLAPRVLVWSVACSPALSPGRHLRRHAYA